MRSHTRFPFALVALLALVWTVQPPAPAAAQAQDTIAADDPPVPQTFDWHLELPNPASAPWGQAVDTAATRLMRSWTTAREFTSPLVDHLPVAEGVVSPMEHFGYPLGRPGVLHTTGEFYAWYEALAASSPRVRFQLLDETEEGRRFALVQVGSERNLARLDEIREGYQRLTDPRVTSEAEMEALIRDLPAVYMVFSGLHSPETGHPEVTAELAYRVAVSDHPLIREIRDNAVLFIMPVTDPDGRDRVVEWYRLHATDVYDSSDRPPGPPFWGKYVRHDNNRDGLQLTLALSRQVVALFEEWKYPVGLDLHESVPFLYVSTGTGPYNPNIDAITRHEWQWIAHHEVTQLTSYGMPGVWTHDFFDGWNPGYMVFALNNRNAIGRFYETFGNSLPTTMERTVGGNRTSVEWFRANPPYSSVTWSIRNNINYAQSGVLHSVHLIARNRDEVLRNYWRKGRNAVERGRIEAPHAWHVPADQPRSSDVAHMLNLLRTQGVELHRLDADVELEAGGTETGQGDGETGQGDGEAGEPPEGASAEPHRLRAGDFLIRADQPYGNFVRNLMERQDFPEDAPRPYDDVAWTFPLVYNVTVDEVADPEILDAAMTPVTEPVSLPGSLRAEVGRGGTVAWWVVPPQATADQLEARWALGNDVEVWAARETFELPGRDEPVPAGAWLIAADPGAGQAAGQGEAGVPTASGTPVIAGAGPSDTDAPAAAAAAEALRSELEAWAARFGRAVVGVEASVVEGVTRHRQELPRLAVLHSWRNTQDDGSVRYALDIMGIPYAYLPEDRLAEGGLRERFDVILFPDQGRSAGGRQIFEGLNPDDGPIAWEPHPDHPALGRHSTTPDMTGGMGYAGLMALREFMEDGGTLLTLGSASTVPAEFAMVRGLSLRSPSGLFSPGSIVRARAADPGHPILWGYDEGFPVFDRFGPYLSAGSDLGDNVVVRFAPTSEVFLSGLVVNPGGLGGQPAVISVPVGDGYLVTYGIRTLHRNQTRGSFSLVWNAVLNWNQLDPVGSPDEEAVAEEESADRH